MTEASGSNILEGMSGDPDINDLARQVAVLEERMNTKQAEYESAADRLRADMASFKVWVIVSCFGAVVTGITLGLAFSG
ncbi:MAG: hypothetical protein OXF74_04280 [Rhodobacteraceae bacterium]|nr:hypothetical protein [Paracoccaceae bacterium]